MDSGKKFYIERYIRGESGVYVQDGKRMSLEDDFGYVRYKSISNINALGKLKSVYTETYPESRSVRVWQNKKTTREQTSSVLDVFIFGGNPDASSDTDDNSVLIADMCNTWSKLYDYLSGCLILWYDEYRQRKMLCYLQEALEPTQDVIKNFPYLECQIKLTNIFGQTFSEDDTTIEEWLKAGGIDNE